MILLGWTLWRGGILLIETVCMEAFDINFSFIFENSDKNDKFFREKNGNFLYVSKHNEFFCLFRGQKP